MRKYGKTKILGVALVVGVLSAGTYAFTNANTVGETFAGQGEGNITGYIVSNIVYASSTTNPHKLSNVQFDLDHAATTVKVSIVNAADNIVTGASGQTWYTCTGVLNHYTCSFGATDLLRPDMSAANELDVVAHS
jgi:hypothetical protein